MTEAIWDARYATGIPVIDRQHEELFTLVDGLRKAAHPLTAPSEIEALLVGMIRCTERHFATEEAHMARAGYPEMTGHLAEHVAMLTSLHELLGKFRENPRALVLMVPTFMESWLRHHISEGDFAFATFLRARSAV